jgi:hypothetical protein
MKGGDIRQRSSHTPSNRHVSVCLCHVGLVEERSKLTLNNADITIQRTIHAAGNDEPGEGAREAKGAHGERNTAVEVYGQLQTGVKRRESDEQKADKNNGLPSYLVRQAAQVEHSQSLSRKEERLLGAGQISVWNSFLDDAP